MDKCIVDGFKYGNKIYLMRFPIELESPVKEIFSERVDKKKVKIPEKDFFYKTLYYDMSDINYVPLEGLPILV